MRVAVTGAFGYSGRYIARDCLQAGHTVVTLTNSVHRCNPFGDAVRAFPFDFQHPAALVESLSGTDVLINTYWVRFNHRLFTHQEAVANTRVLFQAAKDAGVRRIVHVSITNPDIHSNLSYFRGKAEVEAALGALGVSYCILRPAVLFGKEDVLINNIAWSLRHLPVIGVFGAGDYRLQPIYVGDLAGAATREAGGEGNRVVNAIGPETFTYRAMVEAVAQALGVKRLILGMPPALGYWACQVLGFWMKDRIITREEVQGLMQNRLCVEAPPLGDTRLTDWMVRHRDTLGRRYTSEMARRLDRASSYRSN